MKRFLTLMLSLCLCCSLLAPCAYAAGGTDLTYDLTVDGGESATVKPGDIVTVSFVIKSKTAHSVRILQNEIIYDQSFFEYVPGSAIAVKGGGNALFQTRTNGTHIIKASYLSPSGGSFQEEETFCTFQLRVVGTSGSGWVTCDWNCAKAYDGNNKECVVRDGDADALADLRITANGPCHTFTDVKDTSWYHSAVDYVSLRGLMGSVGNNKFNPNGNMTRAMLVAVLYRMSGSPSVEGLANNFADVPDGQWYTDAIIWANANGVVSGIGNGKFGPTVNLTREQIATIMCRYAAQQGVNVAKTCSLAHFTDKEQLSSWADASMRWANSVGLITGRTATTLAPKNTATRAEVASMLMRLCENVLG